MNLFVWGLAAFAICLCVYALDEWLKKEEWVKKDAEESNRKILAKPYAEVTNPDQVSMAEMLKIEIEAHKINDLVDDIEEEKRLSEFTS